LHKRSDDFAPFVASPRFLTLAQLSLLDREAGSLHVEGVPADRHSLHTPFNSGIDISDSALGPSHPRSKLVFLNETFGEAVDRGCSYRLSD
jgi:hypothetical protein